MSITQTNKLFLITEANRARRCQLIADLFWLRYLERQRLIATAVLLVTCTFEVVPLWHRNRSRGLTLIDATSACQTRERLRSISRDFKRFEATV
jgi:hypothetical protein